MDAVSVFLDVRRLPLDALSKVDVSLSLTLLE